MRIALPTLLALLLTCGLARAATFQLKDGGQVEGELVNVDESPRTKYVVRTASGVQVTLPFENVKKVITPSPAQLEFEQVRHTYPDTVEGQWALADWCREHNLINERHTVLRRVVELDPNHAKARVLLGYVHIDGKWTTQREAMEAKGYVEFRGKWVLPQAVDLAQQDEANEAARKEWYANVKLWRAWLDDPKKHDDALAKFHAIEDPLAILALRQAIEAEQVEAVRLMLIDVVAHVGGNVAREVLCAIALKDENEEARMTALDHLARSPQPESVSFFVQRLKDKDNVLVNRAALALGHLKNPSAVGPLIDALVTDHKYMIVTGPPQGSTSAAFSPSGGSGFSTGGGPKMVVKSQMNPAALEALSLITGRADWGYDEAMWKKWFATQRPSVGLDARRD